MRLGPIGRQIDPIPSSVRFTLSPTSDRDAYRAARNAACAVQGLGGDADELAEMLDALGLDRESVREGRDGARGA